MIPFALLLTAALALPLALWLVASRHTVHALSLTAATCGLIATGIGLWVMRDITTLESLQPDGATFQSTYYVLSPSPVLRNMGLLYIAVAAGLALITHLGPRIICRLIPPTFATFHLGSSLTVLFSLTPPFTLPRRYADYPDYYQTLSQINSLAAALTFLALAALSLLLLAALLHHALRRYTAL
jgi:hypothetical protein